MSGLTAVGSYQAIRKEGPALVAEANALAEKINDFLTKVAPLATATLPSKALFQNLQHENPEDAAAAQTQANELTSLQKKGRTITATFNALQLALNKFQSSYAAADAIKRPETEKVAVAEVETNDAVFAALKTAFDVSQKTVPAQLKSAQEAATAAANFVDQVNTGVDEVDAEKAEANLTLWNEAAQALAPYILDLKKTQASLGADKIFLANETAEDQTRLATLDQTFAKRHEENFTNTKNYRNQLEEMKITVGDQLGELQMAHATLQSSLQSIEAIKANGWKRVQGYFEGLTKVLVNALSGSQTDQYKTQAQRLSEQMGAMNRKIADADEGSLVHDDLDAELATYSAAFTALENDYNRLEKTDKESLSDGIGELKRMYQELLDTQKAGWKKPAESTIYTRIFGKKA